MDGEIKLKDAFKNVVNDYMKVWCNKHDYQYEEDMWVGNNYGDVCMVGDLFASFDDVRYDVDNNLPENVFEEWYWYSLEISELGCNVNVNLKSYAMGYRPYSEEQLDQIRKAALEVEAAKERLVKLIEETKAKGEE